MNSDMLGSDELFPEEIEAYAKIEEEAVKALEDAANVSAEARRFLSTKLGRALRAFVISNRQEAYKIIATEDDDKVAAAKVDLEVINTMAQFFGNIIVGGDQALVNLDQMRIGQ